MNTPKLVLEVLNLFKGLPDDEVLRIELVNGKKIYCASPDTVYLAPSMVKIVKPIKDKTQKIIIDPNAIAVVCTMSRKTYDLKLQRGELYV